MSQNFGAIDAFCQPSRAQSGCHVCFTKELGSDSTESCLRAAILKIVLFCVLGCTLQTDVETARYTDRYVHLRSLNSGRPRHPCRSNVGHSQSHFCSARCCVYSLVRAGRGRARGPGSGAKLASTGSEAYNPVRVQVPIL